MSRRQGRALPSNEEFPSVGFRAANSSVPLSQIGHNQPVKVVIQFSQAKRSPP